MDTVAETQGRLPIELFAPRGESALIKPPGVLLDSRAVLVRTPSRDGCVRTETTNPRGVRGLDLPLTLRKGIQMKHTLLALSLLALVFTATSCHRHVYNVGSGAPDGAVVYEDDWHDHWLFGAVNTEDPVDLAKYCPSGNATVTDEMSFVNGLVAFFVGIVYSPTSYRIQCADGTAHNVPLDREDAARIAARPDFVRHVGEIAPHLVPDAILAHQNALRLLKDGRESPAETAYIR